MNDYRKCFVARLLPSIFNQRPRFAKLTPERTTFWHREAVTWLHKELSDTTCTMPTIVLSHHAPLGVKYVPEQYQKDMTYLAYYTDLLAFTNYAPATLRAWAFGHTHVPFNQNINGVHFVNNPEGYPNEQHLSANKKPCIITVQKPLRHVENNKTSSSSL